MTEGDYVRTKHGIEKITDIKEWVHFQGYEKIITTDKNQYETLYEQSEIIKSSPSIIDLIELGDILVIKDFVDEACMIFTDIYLIQNEQQLLNIKNDLEKNKNKKLYSIITKEQFSCMEYKIGE